MRQQGPLEEVWQDWVDSCRSVFKQASGLDPDSLEGQKLAEFMQREKLMFVGSEVSRMFEEAIKATKKGEAGPAELYAVGPLMSYRLVGLTDEQEVTVSTAVKVLAAFCRQGVETVRLDGETIDLWDLKQELRALLEDDEA